jgi:diacylglycerol kinase (ATP)
MSQKFSLKNRVISFKYAFNGLRELFIGQHNAQIHLLAMFAVIIAGVVVEISRQDWLIVILTIALVLMAEAMNTAIEYLADACVPEHHPLIAKAKDIAAAGVLVCAIAALVVALFVFLL